MCSRHLSFRTLQHGNAFCDALRHLLQRGITRSSSSSHSRLLQRY
ncbi:DUF1534 domain-containing protein [Pseudomonas caricapapayae]|nr:DUF1534 domain-containing protein [Pseudomonas caricapapayae]